MYQILNYIDTLHSLNEALTSGEQSKGDTFTAIKHLAVVGVFLKNDLFIFILRALVFYLYAHLCEGVKYP